ncbi:MAG: acetyl-CoA carboxylase, carboxyltransferase subunit beta [Angelakisella sp.]|nr:acetyl-CoA carboxylase, carboxyltransferase subunit beta [Angelakisella sp.]
MNDFFSSRRERLFQLKAKREQAHRPVAHLKQPFQSCPGCQAQLPRTVLAQNMMVCPHCGHHFSIGAHHRLSLLLDKNTFRELDRDVTAGDPLEFPGYATKLDAQKISTGLSEAVVTAQGKIGGYSVVVAVMDSRFLMGSMGVALGEKITRAAEYAQKSKLPLIIFCASGGARMQEGILSLMQMAKTSGAIQRFSNGGGLYISCLTHPTTGGVTASFASLGDVTLAEPGALIGFAGPRVIEQTIGQKLPEGFQRAEFLQQHGYVDKIVARNEMKAVLTQLLALHTKRKTV